MYIYTMLASFFLQYLQNQNNKKGSSLTITTICTLFPKMWSFSKSDPLTLHSSVLYIGQKTSTDDYGIAPKVGTLVKILLCDQCFIFVEWNTCSLSLFSAGFADVVVVIFSDVKFEMLAMQPFCNPLLYLKSSYYTGLLILEVSAGPVVLS